MSARTVLVAGAEGAVPASLALALRQEGYRVLTARAGTEALEHLAQSDVDLALVVLDAIIPRQDAIELIRRVRQAQPDLPLIACSGQAAPPEIVQAMKAGASEFLHEPRIPEQVVDAVRTAVAATEYYPPSVVQPSERGAPIEPLVATGVKMREIRGVLKQIAASDAPAVLRGESGVGKEVLAREIHSHSARAAKPFLKINCAALPSELLESELFGFERGAFTGAMKSTPGKFEIADGGTILLDEIGDMDIKLQAKLLHVLQDQEFQKLGSCETVRVNVRILSATHCDLELAVRERRFRQDLYYRLNVITINIPALRERKDEILPLAEHFIRKHSSPGAQAPRITPALKDALLAHDWPGNIRELENVIRRLLIFGDAQPIVRELRQQRGFRVAQPIASPPWLPQSATESAEGWQASTGGESHSNGEPQFELADSGYTGSGANNWRVAGAERSSAVPVRADGSGPVPITAVAASPRVLTPRERAEAAVILNALNQANWVRKRAAALLNMDYQTLLYRMKRLGIRAGQAPDGACEQIRNILDFDYGQDGTTSGVRAGAVSPSALEQINAERERHEVDVIMEALNRTNWNRKKAAELLNSDYKGLLYRMKRLGIGARNGDSLGSRPARQARTLNAEFLGTGSGA